FHEATRAVAIRAIFPCALPSAKLTRVWAALGLYIVVALLLAGAGGAFGAYGLPGIAAMEVVLVAAPSIAFAAIRGGAARGLALTRPRLRHVVGAALVGLSLWYVLLRVVMPLQELVAPTPPALEEALMQLAGADRPILGPLVAVALVPAICEELLCRGVLLGAMPARWWAVPV